MPEIGQNVRVRYLGEKPGVWDSVDGVNRVFLGSERPTLVSEGVLGVELNADGRAVGLVVQGDGSADFIPTGDVVSVEVL